MTVLVTGSAGLIGSEAVLLFESLGCKVHGVDNNSRQVFFGVDGDTSWNLERLHRETKNFENHTVDIRDSTKIEDLIRRLKPDHVIHCAAQPAHDYARQHPDVDFSVNVEGTINLLEACRKHAPVANFIFCSSSKVYGSVNSLPFKELATRYELDDDCTLPGVSSQGINEDFPISGGDGRGIYGSGKAAADLLVQEYGRTYGMRTVCLRGNCMTGPAHSPAELHGFLAYLALCLREGRTYNILGFKGKQVRDIIHSSDFVKAVSMIYMSPPEPGTVYNLGGGRKNSVSIREASDLLENITGKQLQTTYQDEPRHGDHRIYISDTTRFRKDYPGWEIGWSIEEICQDLINVRPRSPWR